MYPLYAEFGSADPGAATAAISRILNEPEHFSLCRPTQVLRSCNIAVTERRFDGAVNFVRGTLKRELCVPCMDFQDYCQSPLVSSSINFIP